MTQEEVDGMEILLKLPVALVNIALQALSNLPYKDANVTINVIQSQAQEQINAEEVKEAAALAVKELAEKDVSISEGSDSTDVVIEEVNEPVE